jgi:SAM-dependent methyltransferase
MHLSSLENMKTMLDRVLTPEFIAECKSEQGQPVCRIVDYGGRRVEGHDSYFSLLATHSNVQYVGVDIEDGDGVDVVMTDPYCCPLPNESVDVIITGQMFEHCEFFWLTIQDMARMLRPGGYVLAITPAGGVVHRYPVDCWRFYPDAYAALAKWSKLELVDAWQDARAKWYDQVGMLRKPNDINSNT